MRRLLRSRHRTTPTSDLFSEILYDTRRIRTLQENFTLFPQRVCTALHLQSCRIYLADQHGFTLRDPETLPIPGAFRFASSSSVMLRLKRESKPAPFSRDHPDGWQFLATPEEVEALEALGTQVLVPLEGRTALTGFLTLSRSPGQPAFTATELSFLEQFGTAFGQTLETALFVERLSQDAVRRAHITRELALAREVQERLLPGALPSVPGLEAAAAYRSAEQVGGDYYDLFPTASGRLCVVIADISGHGISSALLMATLRASLHSLMEQADDDLAGTVDRLNRLLYTSSSTNRYATLFVLLYQPGQSVLSYVNAGHNPPLLLRANGSLERLTAGGTVIGLLPSALWQAETLSFHPGDTLVAFTDGITETCNEAHEEWGEEGLLHALLSAPEGSAPSRIDFVLDQLRSYTGSMPQMDDRTLLLLRRQP